MTPDTVHFVAQMIRHHRAQATSFEKWIRKQPPSPACREMLQVLAVYRGVLTNVEAQIAQFDVAAEPEEDVRSGRPSSAAFPPPDGGSPVLPHEPTTQALEPACRK